MLALDSSNIPALLLRSELLTQNQEYEEGRNMTNLDFDYLNPILYAKGKILFVGFFMINPFRKKTTLASNQLNLAKFVPIKRLKIGSCWG